MTPTLTDIAARVHPIFGAVFNLNRPASYLHWSFIDLSMPNVTVIVVMLFVFALAVYLPFPDPYGDLPPENTGSNIDRIDGPREGQGVASPATEPTDSAQATPGSNS